MRLIGLLLLLSGCAATVRPLASVTEVPPLGPATQVVLADGRILAAPNLRAGPDSVRRAAGDGTTAPVECYPVDRVPCPIGPAPIEGSRSHLR